MRVAILGYNELSLELALKFHQLETQVVIFKEKDEQLESALWASARPEERVGLNWETVSTAAGRELFGQPEKPIEVTWQEYFENYISPLNIFCEENNLIQIGKSPRIGKTKLHLKDSDTLKERFNDSFRVIFEDQTEISQEQLAEMPEAMKNIYLASEGQTLERFFDFDIVVNSTKGIGNLSAMGAGGIDALGEINLKERLLSLSDDLDKKLEKVNSIALVGSGRLAIAAIHSLNKWLQKTESELFLVTREDEVFSQVQGESFSQEWVKAFRSQINTMEESFHNDKITYEKNLFDYRDLSPEEKKKSFEPISPKRRIEFIPKTQVMSFDRLIDQDKIFVSLESESLGNKVRTLGVDYVINACGTRAMRKLEEGIMKEDLGYFFLDHSSPNWFDCETKVKSVETELYQYFQRRD